MTKDAKMMLRKTSIFLALSNNKDARKHLESKTAGGLSTIKRSLLA